MTYQLIDCGGGEKLEQLGEQLLIRPAATALWRRRLPQQWKEAQATFSRSALWQGSLPS